MLKSKRSEIRRFIVYHQQEATLWMVYNNSGHESYQHIAGCSHTHGAHNFRPGTDLYPVVNSLTSTMPGIEPKTMRL